MATLVKKHFTFVIYALEIDAFLVRSENNICAKNKETSLHFTIIHCNTFQIYLFSQYWKRLLCWLIDNKITQSMFNGWQISAFESCFWCQSTYSSSKSSVVSIIIIIILIFSKWREIFHVIGKHICCSFIYEDRNWPGSLFNLVSANMNMKNHILPLKPLTLRHC